MYHHLYLRRGTVYLPTVGKMGEGFYRDVEPLDVISASNTKALRQALAEAIARGNPNVPMLQRHEWAAPLVLKQAGVKSWSAFERGMQLWAIEDKDGAFRIIGKKKKPDGTTIDDPEKTIAFPSGATVHDVIERMMAILQNVTQKQQ